MARAALVLVMTLASARAWACPPQLHVRDLGTVWERAATAVRDELADRDDVDRCVELEISSETGAAPARLDVWFPDGRHATRSVERPQVLRATGLALVLVIAPGGPAPSHWEVHQPELREVELCSAPAVTAEVDRPSAAHALAASVALGEHWTTNERGASAGAGVSASRGAWSARARTDFARARDSAGFTTTSFELGAELGYRIAAGVPLTFVAGPRVVWLAQSLDDAPFMGTVTTGGKPNDGTRSAAMVRAGGGIIAGLAATRGFALAIAARAETDLASDIANRGTGYVTPELPEWSFELALEGEVRLWP